MLCQFNRLLYPSNPTNLSPSQYMVATYIPCEKVLDSSGKPISEIKAVGYSLPTSDKIKYEMKGAKNAKSGILSIPSISMP